MGETSSKEELLQLIKRVGSYLSVKISNLFPFSFLNLDSRSVGAIAGLAFAIVFTWRIFRSPSAPQRRQPKQLAPASSTSVANTLSNVTLTPSGACSSSEDLQVQNVDEFFQLVKPTLGQIVRQKLSEGRKVTCRLLGVILEESSPEELQKQATVRSSVLEVLLEITKFCDLYPMERVLDDESEQKVLTALENAGVFTSGGLVKDKVLFCSTENGRSSFVRQLEPDWHIDSNPEIVSQLAVSILVVSFIILVQQCCSTIMILLLSSQCCLTKFLLPLVQRFIKFQLHVSPIRSEWTAANVFSSPSLEQFFGCI